MSDSSWDFLDSVLQEINRQMKEELDTMVAPVIDGHLDPAQWCLDAFHTRGIPLAFSLEYLLENHGIVVSGLEQNEQKKSFH